MMYRKARGMRRSQMAVMLSEVTGRREMRSLREREEERQRRREKKECKETGLTDPGDRLWIDGESTYEEEQPRESRRRRQQ